MTSLLLPTRNERPPSPFRSTLRPIYNLKFYSSSSCSRTRKNQNPSSCCSTSEDDMNPTHDDEAFIVANNDMMKSGGDNDQKQTSTSENASVFPTSSPLPIIPRSRRAYHMNRSIAIDNPNLRLALMKRLQVFENEALYFAKIIQRESLKRIHVTNAMNYVMSIGGGWASVKNSKKAMECSRILSFLAISIGDDVTARRCAVFEGYALMWEGKNNKTNRKSALKIFERIKELAELSGDVENGVRCEHGMKNLLWDFDADKKTTTTTIQ